MNIPNRESVHHFMRLMRSAATLSSLFMAYFILSNAGYARNPSRAFLP
jgi:hypothetical protein